MLTRPWWKRRKFNLKRNNATVSARRMVRTAFIRGRCVQFEKMKEFIIDGDLITDWKSFHFEFKSEMNFPDYYGENMDAWIDCVDDISDIQTVIKILNGKVLNERNPEFAKAILECAAFINQRKIEAGEEPSLLISGIF